MVSVTVVIWPRPSPRWLSKLDCLQALGMEQPIELLLKSFSMKESFPCTFQLWTSKLLLPLPNLAFGLDFQMQSSLGEQVKGQGPLFMAGSLGLAPMVQARFEIMGQAWQAPGPGLSLSRESYRTEQDSVIPGFFCLKGNLGISQILGGGISFFFIRWFLGSTILNEGTFLLQGSMQFPGPGTSLDRNLALELLLMLILGELLKRIGEQLPGPMVVPSQTKSMA